MATAKLSKDNQIIKTISDQLVKLQQDIRILDAIKWDDTIEKEFFAHDCRVLPKVNKEYYHKKKLPYDPKDKIQQFYLLENEIKQKLGTIHPAAQIMLNMCTEYRDVVRLLMARGTKEFHQISRHLYGSSQDAFYTRGPTINDLANLMSEYLPHLITETHSELDEKIYSSQEAMEIINEKMQQYFVHHRNIVTVEISDTLVSDAAAGADKIRIRRDARFSARDLRMLEVHEGWVHVGTTLNGSLQPICTFLSKGVPSALVTQEGLAVLMEIFTLTTFPRRVEKIVNRINTINMAEQGADFLDVFNYLLEQGLTREEAYTRTVRVFRGSTPTAGPFTKDLAYNKGFVMLYNFIRVAIRNQALGQIPLLFAGKLRLEDIGLITALVEEGIVSLPTYVPYPLNDIAALSCWLCYSIFMNKLDLSQIMVAYAPLINPGMIISEE